MKPQDILVLLKLHLWANEEWTQPKIAQAIGLSQSETSAAIQRCEKSGLYSPVSGKPVRAAMEEFFIHGLKYCFPATLGAPDRGMPTAHSAPPLSSMLAGGENEIFIWPYVNGNVRGVSVEPLYKSVPEAAINDNMLYECLALIDAIRIGRAREKNLAIKLLIERIQFKVS
jgi:hypothetical protein